MSPALAATFTSSASARAHEILADELNLGARAEQDFLFGRREPGRRGLRRELERSEDDPAALGRGGEKVARAQIQRRAHPLRDRDLMLRPEADRRHMPSRGSK